MNGIRPDQHSSVNRAYFAVLSLKMFGNLQVKELGLLGVDCECLAQDLQRLFDIYWYLSTPGNSLPEEGAWPDQYTALYNMSSPALLTINKTLSSSAFLAVSTP